MTVRRALGVGLALVLVALLVAEYFVYRTCDHGRRGPFQLSVLIAPLIAAASVWLMRFRPKGIWIALLILAPVVAFVADAVAAISGEVAGGCGGY